MDFKDIANSVNVEDVFRRYFPDLEKDGTNRYKARNPTRDDKNPNSFKLFNDGGFHDFSTGESGSDIIATIAYVKKISMKEAAEELSGIRSDNKIIPISSKKKEIIPPLEIVPPDAPKPPYHSKPSGAWGYKDYNGNVIGYIARFDDEKGKSFLPARWIAGKWEFKGFPVPLPLFGAHLLKEFPTKPVMVVSGEKTCLVARERFPDYVVITWPGGDQQAEKAAWTLIRGRKGTILIPDNDDSCKKAMQKIAAIVDGRIVDVPDSYPKAWDIADAEEGDGLAWVLEQPKKIRKVVDYGYKLNISTGKENKPINCWENLQEILDRLGASARHDIIRKRNEVLMDGVNFEGSQKDEATLSLIESECAKFRFPQGKVDSYLTLLCEKNQYNPVSEWIESKPWDGTSRFQELCNTIESPTPQKDIYIRKWMISAIAAAYNHNGVSAEGVLILQGEGGLGKTQWLQSLCPNDLFLKGFILKPDNKDSIKIGVSRWIVELGEIDGTMTDKALSALKAFLTNDEDTFRPPYARKESTFKRRTIYGGTVNKLEFLVDQDGNRRFWAIICNQINHDHGIDIQQLWAEALTWYKAGESHWLNKEERDCLNKSNEDHEVSDNIDELIATKYNWDAPTTDWIEKTIAEILLDIGIDNNYKGDRIRAKKAIKRLAGRNHRDSRDMKARYVLCPPTRFSLPENNINSYRYN